MTNEEAVKVMTFYNESTDWSCDACKSEVRTGDCRECPVMENLDALKDGGCQFNVGCGNVRRFYKEDRKPTDEEVAYNLGLVLEIDRLNHSILKK